MREFRINEFLTVRLVGVRTNLYMSGKKFMQCKRLVLNIPQDQIKKYTEVDSIDEAADLYEHTIYEHEVLREGKPPVVENDEEFSLLSPEEEFWGHCSNLQAWA
ncbi:MAG: hypothetical protein GF353_16130, partial [Candidatus Lokiarchaeota archaeon]|nr:hypothetical protein [Candidatus Lokiarchaeota archaeon]